VMYPPVSPAAARAGGKSFIASWLSSGTHTAVGSPACGGVAKPTESRRFVFTPSPGFRDERWRHHRAGMAQGRDQPIWSVANRVRLQPVRAPAPSPGQGPAPCSGVRQASVLPRLRHAGLSLIRRLSRDSSTKDQQRCELPTWARFPHPAPSSIRRWLGYAETMQSRSSNTP
jgi:hypothetical protein